MIEHSASVEMEAENRLRYSMPYGSDEGTAQRVVVDFCDGDIWIRQVNSTASGAERPYGLMVWERGDLPDAIQAVSGDAFHHFEVLPLDYYGGGAYEIAEQLLEQTPAKLAEALVDRAIGEGHRIFALVPTIGYRGENVQS